MMRTASCKQIRERYGLPVHVTRRLYKSGKVRWYKAGDDIRNTVLVNVDDLEEWLATKEQREVQTC